MSSSPQVQHYDVLIVGAGLQGLVAAKTYLQLEPSISLLILDSNASIGGVWAKENIYPDLKTNNQLGTFEFTDFDIREVCPGRVKTGEHIAGNVVHDYLVKYAENHDLVRRTRLHSKVTTAEHLPGDKSGWKVTIVPTDGGDSRIPKVTDRDSARKDEADSITASKLIVATGMTSTPIPISLPGASTFSPRLLDFHDFRRSATQLLEDPNIKHVAVYGGAKSAYDTVYAFASRGKNVTWIIRASGHGPVYMAPSHIQMGPMRVWLEPLVSMRLLALFSPCIWGERDGFGWIRQWLHGTAVGRFIVKQFWTKLGGDVITQTGLRSKGPEVEKLVPKEEAFWYATGLSILNYGEDVHRYLRDGTVRVVRADVERLEGKRVVFTSGEGTEELDALVCSTGWRWDSGIEFLPKTEHAELGIPSVNYTENQKRLWDQLEDKADEEILERFPMLADGPGIEQDDRVIPKPKDNDAVAADKEKMVAEPEKQKKEEHTPWRLFRGIAPAANPKRDLVFLGMMLSFQTVLRSEMAALWAYAYLNRCLKPPAMLSNRRQPVSLPAEKAGLECTSETLGWLYETALFSRFGRWRYPMGYGARFPDFVFDGLPYADMLLRDLGLRSWRKGRSWLGELFSRPYLAGDYRGMVEEWQKKAST
ncbi:MAG: hypothetical protein L6R40_007360 [Gallowayella cf. fulva]|nr:MAG: hypothetical protein L6R40_007360 [Xanthomendoza cf. fulva]